MNNFSQLFAFIFCRLVIDAPGGGPQRTCYHARGDLENVNSGELTRKRSGGLWYTSLHELLRRRHQTVGDKLNMTSQKTRKTPRKSFSARRASAQQGRERCFRRDCQTVCRSNKIEKLFVASRVNKGCLKDKECLGGRKASLTEFSNHDWTFFSSHPNELDLLLIAFL